MFSFFFLQELRFDLFQACLPFYIYKDKGLAVASVEDVVVHPLTYGELIQLVPSCFLMEYRLRGVRLQESLNALLLAGRRVLYLEAVEEVEMILL